MSHLVECSGTNTSTHKFKFKFKCTHLRDTSCKVGMLAGQPRETYETKSNVKATVYSDVCITCIVIPTNMHEGIEKYFVFVLLLLLLLV